MLARINRNFVPAYWDDFFNDNFFNVQNTSAKGNTSPAVNVLEDEMGFSIEVAAPGIAQENFNIEVENDLLTISAEQQEKQEASERRYLRKEFNFNVFKRSFQLPDTIDVANISAKHNAGILSIELPKKAEVVENAHRRIQVQSVKSEVESVEPKDEGKALKTGQAKGRARK